MSVGTLVLGLFLSGAVIGFICGWLVGKSVSQEKN